MGEQRFVELGDERVLAFEEYGDEQGGPVLFCHGWPSSRSMAQITHEPARDLGIRIISADRPGIRASTFQPNRKLLDWPDIVQRLMNELGIGEFRILAVSGGAPYAYATARTMPERVRAMAIVSGAISISDLADHKGLLPLYRWMLALYRTHPQLLRRFFYLARHVLSVRPPPRLRPLVLKLLMLQPCDAESLRDSTAFEAIFESQRCAWRGGAEGIVADAHIYAEPWGFALEEVAVPVRLWHGNQDRAFSVQLAKQMAARLPNCHARFIDGAGHYSLPIRHTREILEDLISI